MNFIKNICKAGIAAALVVMAGGNAFAQDVAIKGYFRVQNAAGVNSGDQFIEVRGPFTTQPDQTIDDVQTEAGSIIYIEAVQEGSGADVSYKLTHLSSQGIDVALDDVSPEEYEQLLTDAAASGSSIVYGMVQQGFARGYTSVARATVGFVFTFVAARLEKYHVNDDFKDEDFINVTKDFNKNVTANLDLGIRLRPVPGQQGAFMITFDVPYFDIVSKWYLGDGSDEQNRRKEVFEAAMDAMTAYLDKQGVNFEVFTEKDVQVMKSWGYDLTKKYTAETIDGNVIYVSSFRDIFADYNLLFNWIKLFGYKVAHAEEYPELEALQGVADKMKQHYLTALMLEYFPRVNQGSRAHLINGRVNNGAWVSSGNTLGFASRSDLAAAGDNAVWIINPIDNEANSQAFFTTLNTEFEGKYHATRFYDFDVEITDPEVKCHTLTELQAKVVNTETDKTISYIEFNEIDKVIPAGTPFVIESTQPTVQLIIHNDYIMPGAIDKRPDNSFVVGDDEIADQQSVSLRTAYDQSASNFKGVLLPTAVNTEALNNYWGIDYDENQPLHRLGTATQANKTRLSFNSQTAGSIPANEAVYLPGSKQNDNIVLVGEPDDETEVETGVEAIGDDANGTNVIYDLKGRQVLNPMPGNIYIMNGKKIFVTK